MRIPSPAPLDGGWRVPCPADLYYYRLEDLDIYCKVTVHAPICVDWDADGRDDDWEKAHGLNPAFDDSGIDLDRDLMAR